MDIRDMIFPLHPPRCCVRLFYAHMSFVRRGRQSSVDTDIVEIPSRCCLRDTEACQI